MKNLGLTLLVSGLLTLSLPGCQGKPPDKVDPADGNLILQLPESKHRPELDRVSKLTIDGKDFTEPRGTKRTLKVEPLAGKDTVTVVFSFWPTSWEHLTRTKVIKLNKGKKTEADLTREDPDTPDKIEPIFVPTPNGVVDKMCEMAQVGKEDVVYDIGCGDGRMVIRAVKNFGAKKGVGIDIDPNLIKQCKESAQKAGVAEKVEFRVEDALKLKELSDATVVLLYVGDELGAKLEPVLKKSLKPGARIVSHRFSLGDWKPMETKTINAKNNYNEDEEYHLLLWKVE